MSLARKVWTVLLDIDAEQASVKYHSFDANNDSGETGTPSLSFVLC